MGCSLMGLFFAISGTVAATTGTEATSPSSCPELSPPTKLHVAKWQSDALSSREVNAYEFAAQWSPVNGATSYTICWSQNTESRTGELSHTYDSCVTSTATKLNEGYVYFNANGDLAVRVRANGRKDCEASAWVNSEKNGSSNEVSMICTDRKVNSEDENAVMFFGTEESIQRSIYISKIERMVQNSSGAAEYTVTVDWNLDSTFLRSPVGKKVLSTTKLEICIGPTRESMPGKEAVTNFTCEYVSPGKKGSGSLTLLLSVDDPSAAYIEGKVRAVGYCKSDTADIAKVTIASYYKIKVVNPIASGANGVENVEEAKLVGSDGYYIVTTSRTTPDQNIDVDYFVSVLAGLLETWQLPVRTTPAGMIIHDTFITHFDGVVTSVSSNAGDGSSVVLSLYKGNSETATGVIFQSYQGEGKATPEMFFQFKTNRPTTIESKMETRQCISENGSNSEYEPPFKLSKCRKADKTQVFLFEEFAPGWNTPGAKWVYTRNQEYADLSSWKRD